MPPQTTPPANTPVNTNPSPRARFMLDAENIRQHRALIENPDLRKGMDIALAEMTKAICSLANGWQMNDPNYSQACASNFNIIRGAYEFQEVFFRLAEPYAKPPQRQSNPDALHETN